jgi:ComF family protein
MGYFSDFLGLFFPRICPACGNVLLQHEEAICMLCQVQLPKTNFETIEDNLVCRLFWGRVPVNHAASMYYFKRGSKVQHLVHRFKYHGEKEIGYHLGMIYGRQIINSPLFKNIDVIIPVPLHPKKKRKRGYNQSEIFAKGLADSTKIRVDTKTLFRTFASESQTKKSRFKRWENVKEIFILKNSAHLEYKHLLLVDDVITTGATIEACAIQLLKIKGVTISIVSIACTAR